MAPGGNLGGVKSRVFHGLLAIVHRLKAHYRPRRRKLCITWKVDGITRRDRKNRPRRIRSERICETSLALRPMRSRPMRSRPRCKKTLLRPRREVGCTSAGAQASCGVHEAPAQRLARWAGCGMACEKPRQGVLPEQHTCPSASQTASRRYCAPAQTHAAIWGNRPWRRRCGRAGHGQQNGLREVPRLVRSESGRGAGFRGVGTPIRRSGDGNPVQIGRACLWRILCCFGAWGTDCRNGQRVGPAPRSRKLSKSVI